MDGSLRFDLLDALSLFNHALCSLTWTSSEDDEAGVRTKLEISRGLPVALASEDTFSRSSSCPARTRRRLTKRDQHVTIQLSSIPTAPDK